MSNAKHETISDIVREMRTLGRLDEKSTDKIPRTLQALGLRTYADRIEAAAKREREATREKSSQVGNVAAMREALEQFVEYSNLVCKMGMFTRNRLVTLTEKARDAISAPPRNCDLYRTKKELDAAYEKYREYVIMSNSNPFVAKDEMMTKEDWLFAEAKGEAK